MNNTSNMSYSETQAEFPTQSCRDKDEVVKSDSEGRIPNCAAMTTIILASGGVVNQCRNDSFVREQGAPAGWVHSNCPVTCGLCNTSNDHPPAAAPTKSDPALDTCEGAMLKLSGLFGAVCQQDEDDDNKHTPASCGSSTACRELISSLDDAAMVKIKTGLEKCANDPNMAGPAHSAQYVTYATISGIASSCGFPPSTVKASAPALDTCEGAVATWTGLYGAVCPREEGENDDLAMRRAWPKARRNGEQVCENRGFNETECLAIGCCQWNDNRCWSDVGDGPCQGADESYDEEKHTPASCGNSTACKDLISSLDDAAMAQIKTGLEKCANDPDPNMAEAAQQAQYVSYATISYVASGCGFPASTVKVSAPALDTCEGAVATWTGLYGAVCPREEGENDEENHTPASCGSSTACKDLISSLDDCAMVKIKTGLEKCANDPNMAGAAQYAQNVNHSAIFDIAGRCGFPADTVSTSLCVDNDAQVKSDSEGVIQNCAAMTSLPSNGTVYDLCNDESPVIAMGAPAGWVRSRCPVTCGCIPTPTPTCPSSPAKQECPSTAPAKLDTCEGAVAKWMEVWPDDRPGGKCPMSAAQRPPQNRTNNTCSADDVNAAFAVAKQMVDSRASGRPPAPGRNASKSSERTAFCKYLNDTSARFGACACGAVDSCDGQTKGVAPLASNEQRDIFEGVCNAYNDNDCIPEMGELQCGNNQQTKDDDDDQYTHSPATCNTTTCAEAINSVTNDMLACWEVGLQVLTMLVSLLVA